MASSNYTEVKILKRGAYYMTPLQFFHLDEIEEHISDENREEILLLGHASLRQALEDMLENSEAYLVRKEG